MPQRIVVVAGKPPQVFPEGTTDAEISAALNAIPVANAELAPKAQTWTDWAVEKLPTAGAIVGGTLGASGGPVGAALGAGAGSMVGKAAEKTINVMRGTESAPHSVGSAMDAVDDIAVTGVKDALITGAGGLALKGAGAVAGKTLTGAEKLFNALGDVDWNKSVKAIVIPPLVKAGARVAAKAAGTAAKAVEARAAKPVLGSLAEDTALIRASISKGMDPSTAIRIIADGSAEYADALKQAFAASVKSSGPPAPQAVIDLMKTGSFAKLPQ